MIDYFHTRDALEAVSREDLVSRLHDGLVTVLDVRSEDEFALGHLRGALNIPLAELEHRLSELPPDREVVAYCRGPYCVLSFEAVAALRTRGYVVHRLEEGYPEWRLQAFQLRQRRTLTAARKTGSLDGLGMPRMMVALSLSMIEGSALKVR